MRLTRIRFIIFEWMLRHLTMLIVRISARTTDLAQVHRMLNIICTFFNGHLKKSYSAQSAKFLAQHFVKEKEDTFIRHFIVNKLMTKYIRMFLATRSWEQVDHFLKRNCSIARPENHRKAKLLLFTHTGDYWMSVLMAAREYEGMGLNFVVPVYEQVTEENQAMYDKIAIAGVKVTFLSIHNEGVMRQVVRYMNDPHCIVAIFYDLCCYNAGVYNGSVEAVSLFGRHAYMTTGILQSAQRMKLETSLVSCHYSDSMQQYKTQITEPVVLAPGDNTEQKMLTFLQSKISEAPSQWHFIAVLDSYYHFPFSTLQVWHVKQQAQFARLNAKYLGHR